MNARHDRLHTIGVAITTHNRVETTLRCLRSLFGQEGIGVDYDLTIHVVDAGSSDGTADRIRAEYPSVHVKIVGADVYWGTGTRIACEQMTKSVDGYLWLNDDVQLFPFALARLLHLSQTYEGVAVGQLVDDSGAASYGGFQRIPRRPLSFNAIGIVDTPTLCETFNGNVVLVPSQVAKVVGPIDRRFRHAMGDIDYGLRTTSLGFSCIQLDGVVGTCDKNQPDVTPRGSIARLRSVASTKALPPRAWVRFCMRHGGRLGTIYAIKPYLEAIVPKPIAVWVHSRGQGPWQR